MKANPSKRSSLFLLELMIAILFFCLCSAVCVRLFVQSHIISENTQNLNMAMSQTTSFAEIYRNNDQYFDILEKQYSNGVMDKETNSFTVYYDSEWNSCTSADASYLVSLTTELSDDGMSHANLKAVSISTDESLYQFDTEKYVGGEKS